MPGIINLASDKQRQDVQPGTAEDTGTLSDHELLVQIQRGDATAFACLYDRYSRLTYGLALRMLGDPGAAEEVVQESFLTLWRQAESYGEERGAVRSWLMTMIHHRAIDAIRRRRYREEQQEELDELTVPPDSSDTLAEAQRNVEGELIRTLLDELPPDQRHSLVMAYFDGLTHDEIARTLGLPLGTVKGRLRMGLQKLRLLLQARGWELTR